jgi:hypothetical protein
MTASTLAKLESELADIFRNTPTGLTGNTNLAVPKKPASLNAMTHGLTGQHTVLTAEELPLYAKMGLDYMLECQPVGARETGDAQLIFEGRWRLHRILAIEDDLLVISQPREGDPIARVRNPGPARRVNAFREEARNIDLISRYETRIVRNGSRLNAELKELQNDRARQSPDRVFDEATNEAIDWYRRLLVCSEALAKAKQEYEDYEAAQRARTEEKSAEAGAEQVQAASATPSTANVTEPPVSTSAGNSFRKMSPRRTAQPIPVTPAKPHPEHIFTSEPIWGPEKLAA